MQEEQTNSTVGLGSEQEATQNSALVACQEQIRALQDKIAYCTADFENFRRRQEKEVARRTWEARAQILRDVLGIVDDLVRADQDLEAFKAKQPNIDALCAEALAKVQGIDLIRKNALRILERSGVTPVKTEGVFDPVIHEALLYIAREDLANGTIIDTLEKGYMLNGELLRPARVSVAQNDN